MSGERVLVVDDEASIVQICSRTLSRAGYSVRECISAENAQSIIEHETFDLILVDLAMPKVDGLTLIRQAKVHNPSTATIIMTAYGTIQNAIDALEVGARRFLLKPVEPKEILAQVDQALAEYRQDQENLRSRILVPILQISQTLMTEGDLAAMANRLIETVADQFQCDRALLFVFNDAQDELHAISGIGFSLKQVEQARVPSDHEHIKTILCSPNPQPISVSDDRFSICVPGDTQSTVSAQLCVPLWFGGSTVGAMLLSRLSPRPPFAPGDVNILSIVGGQIATALENARLYHEITTARDHFRATLDSLHDQVVVLDKQYTIVDANQAFLERTMQTRASILGRPCYEITHQLDTRCQDPASPCLVAKVWRSEHSARGLYTHRRPTGEIMYLDVIASPLFDSAGQVYQVVEAYRDVTAEHQLQERLEAIQLLGRELVLRRDKAEIVQAVIHAAEHLLAFQICDLWLINEMGDQLIRQGATAAAQQSQLTTIPVNSANGIAAAVAREGQPIYIPDVSQEKRYIDTGIGNRSELCVPLMVQECTIGVLNAESTILDAFDANDQQLFATLADQAALALENADLYERQERAQAHLVQSEKLAALGRLAASLAHEINNPLQALSSGLRLLNRAALEEEKRQQYLNVADREVDRLIGIVERMLGFYRPSADLAVSVDLHVLLDEILTLAAKKIEHSQVNVKRRWAHDLPFIQAVANRLKQVFLNLILNALAAMPDGGTLTISTFVQSETTVGISFADTGCGIEPQHIARIFEPFYTTRAEGTGLGLSISYSIVEQHGGQIAVESQLGQGATFIVTLPIRWGDEIQ
ncbi:MAG: response regulator [Anaerolineae bacterium]|nr:response regulator [Anaerolineae bacterium]